MQSQGRWYRNMYSMVMELNGENLVLLLRKLCFSQQSHNNVNNKILQSVSVAILLFILLEF